MRENTCAKLYLLLESKKVFSLIFFRSIFYLVFWLREQEEENKEEDAVATYERILKINSEHEKACEAIDSIRGLARDAEEFGIDLK